MFQAQRQAGVGVILMEGEQPFPEGLGTGVQGEGTALAGGGVDEVEVGFGV